MAKRSLRGAESVGSLGLQWFLVSVAGWAIGSLMGLAVESLVYGGIAPVMGDGFGTLLGEHLGWATLGGVVGLAQWLVLWQWVSGADRWTAMTVVGVVVGHAVSTSLTWDTDSLGRRTASAAVEGVVFGGLVGLMQWLVLQERMHRAGWWVTASALGLAVGWVAMKALGQGNGEEAAWVQRVASLSTVGALSGAITGLTMIVLVWRAARNGNSEKDWMAIRG